MVELDRKGKDWFMKVVEGLVSKPKAANIKRVRGRFDLEMIIVCHPKDRHIFNIGICLALTELLKAKTGALEPIVYLEGAPHMFAAEAIFSAEHQL